MTFAARERSRDRGEPISLLHFRYGTGAADVFCYTDGETPFTFGGETYLPVPIEVGEISTSGSLDDATITISVDQSVAFVDLFRLRPSGAVVTVVIRQGHANDPDADFLVHWSGRVAGFEIDAEAEIATFGCEPVSTSMQRTMLRRHWQYGCPLVLYGPKCRADRAQATVQRVVTAVSGPIITFDASWETAERKPKYQGGMMEWLNASGGREVRRVLRCSPTGMVQLALGETGLAPGDTVSMILGCNHKTGIPSLGDDGDCAPLHNNIRNFGGDPWIPLENPVGFKNNFY